MVFKCQQIVDPRFKTFSFLKRCEIEQMNQLTFRNEMLGQALFEVQSLNPGLNTMIALKKWITATAKL